MGVASDAVFPADPGREARLEHTVRQSPEALGDFREGGGMFERPDQLLRVAFERRSLTA